MAVLRVHFADYHDWMAVATIRIGLYPACSKVLVWVAPLRSVVLPHDSPPATMVDPADIELPPPPLFALLASV
jgi:hypothetical protein